MTGIGVPGTLDGPSPERAVTGELVISFHDEGPPTIRWPAIPGRSHRQVIGEATKLLVDLLGGDVLDKLDRDPPREPPL